MKIDRTDLKLLWNLDYDARIPLSKLAARCGISKQNAAYRLDKLTAAGVLRGFISLINIHKLGYSTHRVYFRYKNLRPSVEKKVTDYLIKHEHVLWLAAISGSWDLEAVFTAKSIIQFNNLFKRVKEDLGKFFSKYDVSSSIVNYHFKRDYLLGLERGVKFEPRYYGLEPRLFNVDELDLGIMAELSKNCRRSNQEIGRKLGVSYHTVKQRVVRLESEKLIQGHRILIDLEKIGRHYYKAAIKLGNLSRDDEKRIYEYCSQFNSVAYLVEVLGNWQLEIEAEVASQEEMELILRKIRDRFSEEIVDYELFHVTRELKLNYLPMGKKVLSLDS